MQRIPERPTGRSRVAIYTRVSRDEQAKHGTNEHQEKLCREHAAARGWDVAAVYPEVHKRNLLHERPEMTRRPVQLESA